MGLIDTHTHLESFAHKGVLPEVLARAKAAGVEAMITIGTSPEDWQLYRDIARGHRGFVEFTVGLHPCAVGQDWSLAVRQIEDYWNDGAGSPAFGRKPTGGVPPEGGTTNPGAGVLPVGLGECGLDRFHLPKDAGEAEKIFSRQRDAFAAQLEIVKRLGCPVVIHSRGAFRECVEMIDASAVNWAQVVFHCFTEGEAEMAELTRRGGVGSFTGILTYKNADNVRAAAKNLGLPRLMIETDAPYLAPMPHRGKPNEPAFVRHTAEFAAAEVFGVGYDELAATTTANARRFFGM